MAAAEIEAPGSAHARTHSASLPARAEGVLSRTGQLDIRPSAAIKVVDSTYRLSMLHHEYAAPPTPLPSRVMWVTSRSGGVKLSRSRCGLLLLFQS